MYVLVCYHRKIISCNHILSFNKPANDLTISPYTLHRLYCQECQWTDQPDSKKRCTEHTVSFTGNYCRNNISRICLLSVFYFYIMRHTAFQKCRKGWILIHLKIVFFQFSPDKTLHSSVNISWLGCFFLVKLFFFLSPTFA